MALLHGLDAYVDLGGCLRSKLHDTFIVLASPLGLFVFAVLCVLAALFGFVFAVLFIRLLFG
jgi:hypothetical protein